VLVSDEVDVSVLQVTRASSVERGLRSQEHSWTSWNHCSRRHAIQTYSCARRSPSKSIYQNHEFRYDTRLFRLQYVKIFRKHYCLNVDRDPFDL